MSNERIVNTEQASALDYRVDDSITALLAHKNIEVEAAHSDEFFNKRFLKIVIWPFWFVLKTISQFIIWRVFSITLNLFRPIGGTIFGLFEMIFWITIIEEKAPWIYSIADAITRPFVE